MRDEPMCSEVTCEVSEFLDIRKPKSGVQIMIRDDGKVLWIHVDGICRLRVCEIPLIELADCRENSLQPQGPSNGA